MAPADTLEARPALNRLSQGEISPGRLMRALASHDTWVVHVDLVAPTDVLEPAESVLIGDASVGLGETVYLFTDRAAVDAAREAGLELGRFHEAVRGARALAALSTRFEALEVNAGSAADQRWSVRHRYFPMLRLWAQTVSLERRLATDESEARLEAIAAYPAWLVLAEADRRTPKAVHLADRDGNWALAFTAADQLQACQASDRPEAVFQARFRGEQLISTLRDSGFTGLVVNPADQAVTVLVQEP